LSRELKYLAGFFIILAALRLCLLFPHGEIGLESLISVALQLLLFAMCIDIGVHSYDTQRHVYLLFALFFIFSLVLFSGGFVGTALFRESTYAGVYFHVYANKVGLNFLFLMAVVFPIVDYFMSRRHVLIKYVVSLSAVGLIILPLFWSFLASPMQLYHEPEYATLYKMLQLPGAGAAMPDHEVAQRLSSGTSTPATNTDAAHIDETEIAALRPYANEGGVMIIFWKPLMVRSMVIQCFIVLLLAFFLVSNYVTNKPHGAYLDKILFLFFLLCPFEIVHLFAFISSTTQTAYQSVFAVAQYATVVCLLMMVYAFDLRLRFVLSATGKYYEEALTTSPSKVTRWKDEIDTLILKVFVRKKPDRQLGHL